MRGASIAKLRDGLQMGEVFSVIAGCCGDQVPSSLHTGSAVCIVTVHRHILAAYADGVHSEATGGSPGFPQANERVCRSYVRDAPRPRGWELAFQPGGPL